MKNVIFSMSQWITNNKILIFALYVRPLALFNGNKLPGNYKN